MSLYTMMAFTFMFVFKMNKKIRRTAYFWLGCSFLHCPEWPQSFIFPKQPLRELGMKIEHTYTPVELPPRMPDTNPKVEAIKTAASEVKKTVKSASKVSKELEEAARMADELKSKRL